MRAQMLGDLWRSPILHWERPIPPWDCRGGLVNSSLFKQRQRIETMAKNTTLFLRAKILEQTQERWCNEEQAQGEQRGKNVLPIDSWLEPLAITAITILGCAYMGHLAIYAGCLNLLIVIWSITAIAILLFFAIYSIAMFVQLCLIWHIKWGANSESNGSEIITTC